MRYIELLRNQFLWHPRGKPWGNDDRSEWRNLIDALPQLVWTATPDGACDYFSNQWTEYTGVPERELLSWLWVEVLHPDDREPTRQFWNNSVAGRHPYDVEYRVRRRDGYMAGSKRAACRSGTERGPYPNGSGAARILPSSRRLGRRYARAKNAGGP